MKLAIKRLGAADLPLPKRAHPSDAGLDLCADLSRPDGHKGGYYITRQNQPALLIVSPDSEVWVSCGFAFAIPDGFEGQVRGRSGLAYKCGVKAGHLGTIDPAYRGEVKVCIRNEGNRDFTIEHGARIAQLVIASIPPRLETEEVMELDTTDRGASGFGSTGS